jgi:hypothetical protein
MLAIMGTAILMLLGALTFGATVGSYGADGGRNAPQAVPDPA